MVRGVLFARSFINPISAITSPVTAINKIADFVSEVYKYPYSTVVRKVLQVKVLTGKVLQTKSLLALAAHRQPQLARRCKWTTESGSGRSRSCQRTARGPEPEPGTARDTNPSPHNAWFTRSPTRWKRKRVTLPCDGHGPRLPNADLWVRMPPGKAGSSSQRAVTARLRARLKQMTPFGLARSRMARKSPTFANKQQANMGHGICGPPAPRSTGGYAVPSPLQRLRDSGVFGSVPSAKSTGL
jgi:hypothetical protein